MSKPLYQSWYPSPRFLSTSHMIGRANIYIIVFKAAEHPNVGTVPVHRQCERTA